MMETKTDNSFLSDKIALRMSKLPDGDLKVLDVFSGHGIIWNKIVKNLPNQKIDVTSVDIRKDLKYFHIHGDNNRILSELDLNKFNVIDLDAYGIPYNQCQDLFDQKFTGLVFVTLIQTMHGGIPKILMTDVGFTEEMIEKAPSIIYRRGYQYFLQYLSKNGVTKIRSRSHKRKHYLSFDLSNQ